MYKKETNQLIDTYLEKRGIYENYGDMVASLCKSFLVHAGIPYHSIRFRLKTPESLREKIGRKRSEGKIYQQLEDITDLAGIRIILYFSDDIDRAYELIAQEFSILKEKSFRLNPKYQKKQLHGYIAEQEVVCLSNERCQLKEYAKFQNLRAEIQIKSVLQHAWSEIEHGIWYKPKVKEAELEQTDIKDLFAENAELLRQVDRNFVKIRQKHIELLAEYTSKIERHKLKDIPINYDSLKAYLRYISGDDFERKRLFETMGVAQKNQLQNLYELEQHLLVSK